MGSSQYSGGRPTPLLGRRGGTLAPREPAGTTRRNGFAHTVNASQTLYGDGTLLRAVVRNTDTEPGIRKSRRRARRGPRLDRPMNVRGPWSFYAWNAEDRRTSLGPPPPPESPRDSCAPPISTSGWPPYISSSSPGTPSNRSWTWLHSHDIPVRNPNGHSPWYRRQHEHHSDNGPAPAPLVSPARKVPRQDPGSGGRECTPPAGIHSMS